MTEPEQWRVIFELLLGRRVGRGRPGVEKRGNCWIFLGALDSSGYGSINRGAFRGKAHRYVWSVIVGPIPSDMHVLHACDNPACVRPAHLWLGTHTENMQDMQAKGRGNFDGLIGGTHASYNKRMNEWTPEQRAEAARHAAAAKYAGRTLARSKNPVTLP